LLLLVSLVLNTVAYSYRTIESITMASRSHLARPPYVDPNTNIIYDTDNPEYEGWLTKQSMWLKVRSVVVVVA
jgi:hypothetical protein